VPSLSDLGHRLTEPPTTRAYAAYVRALQADEDKAIDANPAGAEGPSLGCCVRRPRQLTRLIPRRQLLVIAGPLVI
jgi:hypothetical protein